MPPSATILIIEDNPITRKMLRVTLNSKNYQVLEAKNGKTALQLMSEYNPDLILQDMLLPDMSGIQLNYRLRALPNGADIPIIALSGFLDNMEEFQASETGLTAFLLKPVESSQLLKIVECYLPINVTEKVKVEHSQKILIVDDNPSQLKLLKLQLIHAGFDVTTAVDGQDALQKIKDNLPDVLVSDVLMPNIDGFELCFTIRNDPELAHLPVILITSQYLEESDYSLGVKVAANYYITRGHDAENIIATIAQCFQAKTAPQKIELIENFKEEHMHRLVRQLERQVSTNAGLSQRCALQTAQLSLLSGVTEALTKSTTIENTLQELLSTCLDAAGISKGSLYIFDHNQNLQIRNLVGYTQTDTKALRNFFGYPEILQTIFSKNNIIQIPSAGVPKPVSHKLLKLANARSMLLIPLNSESRSIGALLLGSSTTDVNASDALSFAKTLGTQVSQAVALAAAFENMAFSDRRTKALMNNASCGIFIIDHTGLFLEVNKQGEKLCDCSKEDIIGKSFREFICSADVNHANASFEETLENGTYGPSEICIKTLSGEIRTSEYSITLVKTEQQPLLIVIATDVTERNQLRTKTLLNDKLAMVGTLAAGIAHEINNPASWILGNLSFLKAQVDTLLEDVNPAQKPAICKFEEIINESIDGIARIRDIVRDLKGFARVDEAEIVPVDLHHILNSVINMITPTFKLHANIEKNFADHLPKLMINSGRLHQVFLNLVMNAAQAIKNDDLKKNKISITTAIEDDFIRIDITDTGIGISPENMTRIFEPFFTTKQVGQGTGLGLSICYDIIHKLDGKIVVKSSAETGSTFSVYLPLKLATKEEEQTIQAPAITNILRKRILLVDDEVNLLKSLKRLLEDQHEITTASSGKVAIQLLAENSHAFDIIITDLAMPEITGADLYHHIVETCPELSKSIIFMSGGSYTPALKAFIASVDNPRIDKPFNKEDLLLAIEKL